MYLFFSGKALLLKLTDSGWQLPQADDIAGLDYQKSAIEIPSVQLLASVSAKQFDSDNSVLKLLPLREVLTLFPHALIEQIIYAEQLLHYQDNQRFCSHCGTKLVICSGQRWLYCMTCQREIYPTINPSMIVRVTRGDEILLAQANHFAPNQWSVLAGFCEVGESLEQTVEREVFEEVGLKVKNIRYFGSQFWPFPHSLMVAFTAEYASGEIVLDPHEMRAAGFFKRNELPGRPSTAYSIANRLIDDFLHGN